MVDVQCLSDCELHKQLEKLGFSAGPILCTFTVHVGGHLFDAYKLHPKSKSEK